MHTVALQSAQINALLTWELSSIYTSALARRVSLFPRPPQEYWASGMLQRLADTGSSRDGTKTFNSQRTGTKACARLPT